jgi:hypothetical protein
VNFTFRQDWKTFVGVWMLVVVAGVVGLVLWSGFTL